MLTATGVPLRDWTTLRLGGPAHRFVTATTRAELYDAVATADAAGEAVLLLGGGSNVVIADDGFPGTVVRIDTHGVEVNRDPAYGVTVTVEAGETWEPLVTTAVTEGWSGVEALSGIPGTVGAAPIQNVGAYGQEVSDTLAGVHVFDRQQRRARSLCPADCALGYRTSMFKRTPERFVVGAVTFRFGSSSVGPPVSYAELARSLGVDIGDTAPLRDVRRAVLTLRRRKGMVLDPLDHDTWSVGSFFTNPLLEAPLLPAGAPAFPQADGRFKTSAAWLIENAGFARGYGNGRVRLSSKHTLALTNRGDATTHDLLALAQEIRDGVRERFGVRLQPEPRLVCCALD